MNQIEAAKEQGVYTGRRPGSTKADPERVKELFAKGCKQKEIAQALGVSRLDLVHALRYAPLMVHVTNRNRRELKSLSVRLWFRLRFVSFILRRGTLYRLLGDLLAIDYSQRVDFPNGPQHYDGDVDTSHATK